MRLSITVLCTLALALVAQGIPIPSPPPSDDGHTTPPPEAPQHPTTPPQASGSGSGGGNQPQHQTTAVVGNNYTPRTDPVHRGSVSWVAPTDYNPPGDSNRPHPFIAADSPSPGGTVHGFSATHGIIGDGQNNHPANDYLPQGHPTAFQPNTAGHDTMINVHNLHETNTAHMFDSTDHRVPTHIPDPGMTQLELDHTNTQRGSATRPRFNFRGVARGLDGIRSMAAASSSRGRGRGNGQPESSTRGRQPTRGNTHGGGEPSRSSSHGSNTSKRGASADKHGEHRSKPY